MNGTLSICVLIVCCCYFHAGSADLDPLCIETKYGKVRGKYSDNREAKVFKSIRFARPVSGANRWKDAQSPEPWPGTLDATTDSPACPQKCNETYPGCPDLSIQNEDCLFLNVFTPSSANPWSKLPVLVFIHGGGYILGYSASKLFDGNYLANHSNVIVVTMNYRLGALGFLVYGSGDDGIKGNFGIKDQRLALQWVQDNIASFGGNPNQVTLSGESAGAMSVAIHMTSIKSAGLFHKAIIESNPFGMDYKTAKNEKIHGNKFASKLSCKNDTDFDCLRDKDVSEILEAQGKITISGLGRPLNFWSHLLPWAPVIDGDQLIMQPLLLFERGMFTKVPTILGTTSAEGILFVYGLIQKNISFSKYHLYIDIMFGTNSLKVRHLYPPTSADNRPQLSDVFADYAFYCPTILAAQSNSTVPVYSYIFDHPVPNILSEVYQCITHACHGAELSYVFHTYVYTEQEKQLADKVSAYWGNFVNTGNPNIPPEHKDVCDGDGCMNEKQELTLPEWPQFTSAEWKSLIMDIPEFQVKSEYRKEYCDVMDDIGYGVDVFEALRQSS